MSLETMSESEIAAYIARMNAVQVKLIAAGEGLLAATVSPAIRMARRRLDYLKNHDAWQAFAA